MKYSISHRYPLVDKKIKSPDNINDALSFGHDTGGHLLCITKDGCVIKEVCQDLTSYQYSIVGYHHSCHDDTTYRPLTSEEKEILQERFKNITIEDS